MARVLVHSCCAPCLTYVHQYLKQNAYDVTAFFYNPNIEPEREYEMRKKCMEYYSALSDIEVIYIEDEAALKGGECKKCYEVRLRAAATYAKKQGFDVFTTTLLISPFQKHELIRDVGSRIGEELGIEFLYHDFREGYYQSRAISQKLNLYRQKYCGCLKSLEDRIKEKEAANEQVA